MSYKLHDEIFNLSQHINKVTRERTASPKMLQMHKILTGRAKIKEFNLGNNSTNMGIEVI